MPRRLSVAFQSLVFLVAAATAGAQPPPPKVNPAAPVLKPVTPHGVQRGTAIDLTLTGQNLAQPTGVWTDFPCKATIPTDNNNGKDAAKLLVHLDVPKDAPMGFHALRLATTKGLSNLRIFCLDDLPQVMQKPDNHTHETAQPVTAPCVVVGQTANEANDYYKVTVQAGQRLSFEVLGRRLGSPIDPQLTLFDVKTGRELRGGHSNDAPGLQTDARLTYTFKDAGDYLVEMRDVSYKGGEDYFYRLRIGDFPCATTPLPLAIKRGAKAKVRFAGPNVDGVGPVEVVAPSDPAAQAVFVTPRGANGLYGWPVSLAVSDLDEAMEQEPNNEPAKANRVAVPSAITGRFEQKGDLDYYVFAAKKGTRYLIDGQTHDLHSPTEIYMTLRDAKNNQIQASDPMKDPRLDFTAPTDGDYYVAVEHLHYWAGPEEVYRLTFTPYQPGFDLSLGLDRYDAAANGSFAFPILATRRDYGGAIDVSVVGPPGVTGQVQMPAGQPPQPGQPGATLTVNIGPDVPVGPLTFLVQGKASINGKDVTEYASVRAAVSQSLAGLPVPPREIWAPVGLAVTEKAPFTLAVKFDEPSTPLGKPANLTVTAVRQPGFTEEIALSATGLPPNVAPALKNIAANVNEVKVQLNVAANAMPGTFPIVLVGKAKHQNQDYSVNAPPANLVVAK
ncbi:MAG TPA: PPC domain-containing protein [Gemmataceae bacterium]|nr:PPC domain-containing protein [Gemmataceae bacterium]